MLPYDKICLGVRSIEHRNVLGEKINFSVHSARRIAIFWRDDLGPLYINASLVWTSIGEGPKKSKLLDVKLAPEFFQIILQPWQRSWIEQARTPQPQCIWAKWKKSCTTRSKLSYKGAAYLEYSCIGKSPKSENQNPGCTTWSKLLKGKQLI